MKLSICIPTYNRKEKILAQAEEIIKTGILSGNGQTELIISDNFSEDKSYEELLLLYGKEKNVFIYRQERNLGIVGNLHFLFNMAKGDYIWFLSDDDPISPSSIHQVLAMITNTSKSFYLLNFKTDQSSEVYWDASNDYLSLFDDATWGGFGLLSIQVLKRMAFVDFFKATIDYNLCQPVAISLYGLFYLGGIMCFDIVAITHHVGDYSWKDKALQVSSVYLYDSILELERYKVDSVYNDIISRLKKMRSFCRSSVIHMIKNKDIKYALRLYKGNLLGAVFFYSFINGVKSKYVKFRKKIIK